MINIPYFSSKCLYLKNKYGNSHRIFCSEILASIIKISLILLISYKKTLLRKHNHVFALNLSFPVYGWKWQEYYSADYRYIPLVESPGVAFIIIGKEGVSPSQRLVNEVFATWPYMVITTLLAALAGIVMWFLVSNNLRHVVKFI